MTRKYYARRGEPDPKGPLLVRPRTARATGNTTALQDGPPGTRICTPMSIHTVDDLRDHLALAMRVELSTVPPYLYALYSIEDQGGDAAKLIRSIVAEEMLHLALAANLLLAVGGEPDFRTPGLRPAYPCALPRIWPPLTLNLAPATPEQLRSTFLVLEQPDPVGNDADRGSYDSLGEFYAAIEAAIGRLAAAGDLFADPRAARQFSDERFYGPIAVNVAAGRPNRASRV